MAAVDSTSAAADTVLAGPSSAADHKVPDLLEVGHKDLVGRERASQIVVVEEIRSILLRREDRCLLGPRRSE